MLDLIGLCVLIIFYLLVVAISLWYKDGSPKKATDLILADRRLGGFMAILTLVATEVGGAFVNGTAEQVYTNGILWCIAPIGYSISMTINGFFFVNKMRQENYVTFIDVLQKVYGNEMGGFVYFPSCIGDILWTAAVLAALGTSAQSVLGVDGNIMICVTSVISVLYTMLGGLYSVACTDVVQIAFISFGLWLAIPFVYAHDQLDLSMLDSTKLIGTVNSKNLISYIDTFVMVICGGIPWQPYYQRALAVKTLREARILSVSATVLSLTLMIPPVAIGAAAITIVDTYEETKHLHPTMDTPESRDLIQFAQNLVQKLNQSATLVLPQLIQATTPKIVSYFCISAISAAVMSSVDSGMLSAASYLYHNVYINIIRQSSQVREQGDESGESKYIEMDAKSGDTTKNVRCDPISTIEKTWKCNKVHPDMGEVCQTKRDYQDESGKGSLSSCLETLDSDQARVNILRLFIMIVGIISVVLAVNSESIYGLWILSADLGYVIVFPQFLCAVHLPTYVEKVGSMASVLVACVLRALLGEPSMGVPPPLQWSDEFQTFMDENIPIRSTIMLISLFTLLIVSHFAKHFKQYRLLFCS